MKGIIDIYKLLLYARLTLNVYKLINIIVLFNIEWSIIKTHKNYIKSCILRAIYCFKKMYLID